jgi:adenosylhomocysteine nucleosidase
MNRDIDVVVLISADAEWRAVQSLFPQAKLFVSLLGEWFEICLDSPGNEVADGPTPPRLVRFFHGGWGKVAAAASTQYVIDRWRPELLINLGTCGGFEGEIERGTVVLAERAVVYDIYEQMGDPDAHLAHYDTFLDLSWLGEAIPQGVRRALLVSGDRDIFPADIPGLKSRFGAIAGDWESGAIAYVAARNGVRCLILRGVTDLVGEQGGEAYGDLGYFEGAAAEIMARLIETLPFWLERAAGTREKHGTDSHG